MSQFEEQSFTLGINPGDRVQCNTTGTAGNADLYVRLGENPDIEEAIFECASDLIGTPIETCTVADLNTTVVWVLLSAYSTVRSSPIKWCIQPKDCFPHGPQIETVLVP